MPILADRESQLLIDGKLVAGSAGTFSTVNPATEEVLGVSAAQLECPIAGIRVGTVNVNGGVWYSAHMPFGGYEQSGIGREMGLAGFEEYLDIKAIGTAAN